MPTYAIHHYETSSGRDIIREFLEQQPEIERAACDEVIRWLETGELDQHPQNRAYLNNGIWELRLSLLGKQYRLLYTTEGDAAYLLVAFIKKTPQTPTQHLERAKKRIRDLKQRRIIR